MNHRCRLWLLLLAFGLWLLPEAARAQQNHSARRPYGSVSPQGDLEQILKANLERLRDMETLRDMFERFGKNNALRDLLEKNHVLNPQLKERLEKGDLDFDWNDADTKKWAGDMLGKMKDKFKDNPEFLKDLNDKLGGLDKEKIDPKQFDRFRKLIEPDPKPVDPGRPQGGMPPNMRPPFPPQGGFRPPQPMPQPQAEPEEDFGDAIQNWLKRAENWQGVGELFRESPAIREALDDLTMSMMNGEGGNSGPWLDRLGNVADFAERGARLFDNFGGLGNIPAPSLPDMKLPSISFGGMPSLQMPTLGSPGAGGGGGLGIVRVVVWIAGLAILGLLAWLLWQRFAHPPASASTAKGWRLGPWPVNPGRVATREELIQAFEFLSLLLLGQAARTWNHLDIAASMGGDGKGASAEQRAAARRLARLYEEARYVPGVESFSPEALADARRNLCFLAGVAAA